MPVEEVREVKEPQEIKEAEEGTEECIRRRTRRSSYSVPLRPKLPLFPLFPMLLLSVLYFAPNVHAQTAPVTADSPSPRDLGGVWMPFPDKRENGELIISGIEEKTRPPLTPWGQARFDAAIPFLGPRVQPGKENNPSLQCEPEAVPKSLILPNPFEIVQIPGRIFMFFEEFHLWRTIWTDGRALPKNPDTTYLGYSAGKWDGDTLVVETIGFNDKPWVDAYGNPRSEQMHLTERYRRVDHDTLELSIVIDDPKAYTKTWVSSPRLFKFEPGWEIGEYFCTLDEEQDYAGHIRKPAGGVSSAAPEPDLKK
jgi:hypothetical protein